MTREQFYQKCTESGISLQAVDLDGNTTEEVYSMRREGNTWFVFYRELGKEQNVKAYWSEGDALNGLFYYLLSLNQR